MMHSPDLRRPILFISLLLQAAMLSFMSGHTAFQLGICALALVGLLGPWRWKLDNLRLLAPVLPLALAFILKMQATPVEAFPAADRPMPYAYKYALCQFCLVLQALHLYRRLPQAAIPGYAYLLPIVVFVYGGHTASAAGAIDNAITIRTYRAMALAQTGLLAALAMIDLRRRHKTDRSGPLWRNLALATALIAAPCAVAVLGGYLTVALEKQVSKAFRSMTSFQSSKSSAGFSRYSWLGSVNHWKTRQSEEIALRVYSETSPGYLRGSVFLQYEFAHWSAWAGQGAPRTVLPETSPPAFLQSLPSGYAAFRLGAGALETPDAADWQSMEVRQNQAIEDALFLPLGAQWFAAQVEVLQRDEEGALMAPRLPTGGVYRAWSPLAHSEQHTLCEHLSDERREKYLQVSESLHPQIERLASHIFQHCETPEDKTRRVARYFRQNFSYSTQLQIPHERRQSPLAYFLKEKPPAHCEYFATAAAMLLRLGGVPCRYVTGFVADERNPYGKYWIARNSDAHAWVEAWTPQRGWVVVEATPPEGVPGINDIQQDRRSEWFWDAQKERLRRWVNFLQGGGLQRYAQQRLRALRNALTNMPPDYHVVMAAAAILILGFWQTLKHMRSRLPRRGRVRAAFRDLVRRMDRRLAKHGIRRHPSETPHAFARRIRRRPLQGIDAELAARWYEAYANLRFSARPDMAVRQELERQMPR